MMCSSDHKPHEVVSGECLDCGYSYGTAVHQMTLKEMNQRRADFDMEPIKQLRKPLPEWVELYGEEVRDGHDLFLESKHATVQLMRGDDWSLWFFNVPVQGKCLSIEHLPENWPRTTICVCDSARAGKQIAMAKKELGFKTLEVKE